MRYLEIEAKIAGMAKNLDRRYIRAFWIAFALVNLAFLFYTVNFMFGDHDWNYVRGASAWNEGAFEGRPLHFVLQAVLFDGQVLPFLNSLFSFAALVLGYILLARYWQVPLTTFNYALFAVFAAVLPYTLVWLYYAKDMLINLSLPLVCVASLLAASAAVSSKRSWLHVPAMALMLFAFASYAAVINFYAVCLLGSAFFAYTAGKPFWMTVREKTLPALDILAALVLYKGMLAFSVLTSSYNTRIISWDYLPQKLLETCSAMFMQFVTPLPFMEYKYKLLLLAFCLLGLAAAVCRGDCCLRPSWHFLSPTNAGRFWQSSKILPLSRGWIFMVWPAFMHLLLPACCVFHRENSAKRQLHLPLLLHLCPAFVICMRKKSGNWDLTRR